MPDIALQIVVVSLLNGYALGSIPFGLLITRFVGLGDIRKIGSGNIGATNVLRTGRKGLAALTLLLDALKGSAAVWFVQFVWGQESLMVLAGAGAFLGHVFPFWLRFRGGKGSATLIGVHLAFLWPAALCYAIAWILSAWITRYSSIASMVASLSTLVVYLVYDDYFIFSVMAFLVLVLFFRHSGNISRLLAGNESKIGKRDG